MANEQVKFMLRLPSAIHERVTEEAEKHNRSMNSEIIAALERVYDGRSEEESGARERAFEDALNMLRFSLIPMKFKVVLDE